MKMLYLPLGKVFVHSCSIFAGAILAVTSVNAQEMKGNVLEEVLVTATKREVSIQDVPLSMTVFGAGDIERNGFKSIEDYGVRIPNLTYGAGGESRADNQLSIAIRGLVGKGTTGFYIDETPLLESVNPQVVELERIEVLRGPQGTLYGARSMGGTIRLITKQPLLNQFEGSLHAGISNTKDGDMNYQLDGSVNIPVVDDRFGLRILGYTKFDSGWLDRVPLPGSPTPFNKNEDFNDSRVFGGQITGRISLMDDNLIITPRFAFEDTERDGRNQADITEDNRVNGRLFDIDEKNGADWELSTLTIEYTVPYGDFVSSTSYFERAAYDKEDGSEILNLFFSAPGEEVPVYLAATDDDRVFSQEIRFVSDFDGPVQFTAGVFFQESRADLEFLPTSMEGLTPVVFTLDLVTEVEELAAFVETTFDVTENLRFIVGLRYFDNEVDFISSSGGLFGDPTVYQGAQKESDVIPKFGVQYDIDEDHMIYATAAKGFRIGGVNSFNADACAGGIASLGLSAEGLLGYESDSLWSYEGGFRTTWLDRRLTVNASVFYIDWSDLQQRIGLGSCGFYADTNVGAAENLGFEVEVDWSVSDNLALFFGAGYTDAEITENDGLAGAIAVGQPVQNVPDWTLNGGFDYDFRIGDLPVFLHADVAYVGESYNGRNSGTSLRERSSFTIANIRAGVEVGGLEITTFVSNLTDEKANLQDVPPMVIEFPGRPRILVNRPRTVGLEFRVKF